MKKIILVIAIFFSVHSFGQTLGDTFAVSGINYIVTKATLPYEVAVGNNTGFVGEEAYLPDSVIYSGNTFAVTSIGNRAFAFANGITSVTIGNSVTIIGAEAFNGLNNLASINLPASVAYLGDYAFANCYGLTSVYVNWNTPLAIGSTVFDYNRLYNTTLYVPAGTRDAYLGVFPYYTFKTINDPNYVPVLQLGDTFAVDGLNYRVTKDTEPYEVEVSNNASFVGAATIPTTVSNTGNSFAVTKIGNNAFDNCSGLSSISIPNSVTDIGAFSFYRCIGLNSITIPNSVTSIGFYAFAECTGLTSFVIPNSVTSITAHTFSDCIGLSSVTIPNTVTYIGDSAFSYCTGLTAITIPNSVTSLDQSVFSGCRGLTSVTIPDSITSIGEYIFQSCSSLQSVSLSNSLTSISDQAFAGCLALTTITIPNSVTSIGATAFEGCRSLTAITIPNSVTSIGYYAFANCHGLKSLYIPDSLTSIGEYAFYECSRLNTVSIPNSVTSIGIEAFSHCTSLTNVIVNWTTPLFIDRRVFEYLTLTDIKLTVPDGTQMDYETAYVWTDFRIVTALNNEFNYCKGALAQPLIAPFPTGSVVRWYTVSTSGRVLAAAPTPTTSIVGTKLYYVSEVVGGVESARETITVNTFALPATPGAIIGTAAQGALVGTTNTATYSIADVVGAVSYVWTTPPGVNIISGQGTNTVTVNFANVPEGAGAIGNLSVVAVNSNDCNSLVRNLSLTKALPIAPSSIRMTDATLPIPASGIPTAVTTFAPYMGTTTELTLTARPVATATSYVWELPTGVNVTNGSATTVGGVTESTSNVITVNFSGVTNTNTFNYLTTATVPVATNNLRIGVYSKNGTGLSTTNNAALANSSLLFTPNNTSTARLLTLTAVRPVAPTSLKMYNPLVSSSVAVTDISKFIGTNTELTLTAAVSKLASSYTWEIPSTVTVVAGSDLTSNSITINFLNVPAGTALLYLGVKAVNGIGSSVTVNPTTLVPATTSEARLLKVIAIAPSIVSTVTGSLKICPTRSSDVVYSIATAATRANTYNITVPMGCTINGGTTNTATIVATAGATFTVNYPAGFTANTTTAIRKIFIQSENGFGVSTTNKSLSLTNVSAVCAPRFANTTIADEFDVIAYPNPSSSEFTIETSAKGAINVRVYDMQGRLVENTNSTQVGSRLATGTYNVIVNQGTNTKSVRVIKK